MAAPSEEKLIYDTFNLEALTVNQVKSFGQYFVTESTQLCGRCHLCLHFVDNMCSV